MNHTSRHTRRTFKRVHILPSLITLGNFACGFLSIVLCLNVLFFSIRAVTMDERDGLPTTDPVSSAEWRGEMTRYPDKATRNAMAILSSTGNRARAAGLLNWACVVIFFGMIFDMLDGKIARHMGADSAFGRELDSLADIASFGIAPAVLVNTVSLAVMPVTYAWWTQVIIFGVIFAVCAVLRLARYNIESGTGDKNLFSGLPSPAAAGCVVSAVLLSEGNYEIIDSVCAWLAGTPFFGVNTVQVKARLLSVFLLLPGLLMVSTIPYTHVANRYFSGKKSFGILVVAVLLLASMWHEPRLVLFLAFNGYMIAGLVMAAWQARSGDAPPKAAAETDE